jgi:hypothetical protein
MPEIRKDTLATRVRQAWPALLIGLGLAAAITWSAALIWLLIKLVQLASRFIG